MTPSELKYNVGKGSDRFFFTRDTMKMFGDTMANYGVRSAVIPCHWSEDGNTYLEENRQVEAWELYRKHPVKHGLRDSAYFDKVTFSRIFPSK